MNRILLILVLIQISLNAFPQNLAEELNSILKHIGNNTPADQLFLHLDRNLYHGGDTIRFQTYIRDRQTGVFETSSRSLYVLLLNSDHVTIDSARFRISYSTASGWLKVPELTQVGYYSILAYTSDQMNYDPEFAFSTLVRIDRINQTKSIPEPEESDVTTEVDLRFLPEGGTYIFGVRQRLAFNAVNSKGKNIKVSGDIVNQDGKKITEFKSDLYGPGVVELTPVQGESYYAKPVEPEFGNISWPLPEPEKSGVSLRVSSARPGSIDIIVRGRESPGKQYFLTVTMNNILFFSRDIKPDTLFSTSIETDEIPAGTAYVTLYDSEFNSISERLVFLNANKKMNVHIGVSNPIARPGSETELTINTTDEEGNNISSIISVSAIDSSLGFYNGIPFPDIESIFLYDNEFYNNLPHSIKCTGLKNIDNKSVDLLMMTYGWRKYTLKETAMAYQGKRLDNYDHLKISSPGKDKKAREVINIISPEGGEVITLSLNENMETLLSFDSLDVMARQIMILPDEDPSRNSNPVNIEFPENKEYANSAKQLETDSAFFEPEFVYTNNDMPLFNPDSAIMIDAVTIKGTRKKQTDHVASTAQQFKYAGGFTLYSKDFEFAHTFEDILYKLGAYYVDKRNKMVILRAIQQMPKVTLQDAEVGSSKGGRSRSALIVVDNNPIYDNTYSPIAQMSATDIASITVLRGPQGFAVYGNSASNGAILVTTKTGNRINGITNPDEVSNLRNDLLKAVRVFRSEAEYYIPKKEQVEFVPEYQFRPTILWKDEIFIDESGPVKLKYPNNMGKGTVMIFVNGVSIANQAGSNKHSYMVQ
jgi:TonB-dependent SusC/RagA subfamily outer membrane receptor